MATKKPPRKTVKNSKIVLPREIQNEGKTMIANGLSEAILGFQPGGIGTQLNQVDTLFKNNRWYLISNMRQLLSEIYVEHGLVQTVVDVPVDDAMRGGVEIKSKQLSPEQVEELNTYLEREDILGGVVGRAGKWNRLYGGAGIIILTDQDPSEPLSIGAIGQDSNLEFRAVDMWELFWDKQNVEGYNPAIQEHQFEHYNYYGLKLHKSRVMKMKGLVAPSFIRPRLRGWGFSIVEALVNSINQYLKANNLSFEVLDEFKLDIFKFQGLNESVVSAEGVANVQRRVQMANQQKNFQNALTMDTQDEYDHKQLSFAGIGDVMKEIRMQVASDLRMPLTKIFGISSAGFSSGEDDIENYNAMVESSVRAKSKFEIIKILELCCQKLYGSAPTDIQISFKPLRILSSEQEENVKTQKFNRLLGAKQAGEITTKEFRDACNKDNLLGIQLDVDTTELEVPEDQATEAADEGANKADSQKAKQNEKTIAEFANAYESLSEEEQNKLIENPGHVDEGLWDKAKKASEDHFGQIKWPFVMYLYKEWGGT